MPRILKDLKKFKGNDYGSDFILVPVDRKNKVEDIKNLDLHQVNVCGYIGKNEGGNRRVPVKLLRLDKLKDNESQFEQLYKILEEKKKAQSKANANASGASFLKMEHTLGDLIDKFLVDVAWEFKDFKSYRQRGAYWKRVIGDLPLSEVTTGLVKEHKYILKSNGPHGISKLKPATVNRYVETLQRAFRFAQDIGWANDCPISNKKVPKDPEVKRVRWLDDEELKRLFDAVELSTNQNLKDLIHFSLNSGCRESEALGLRWKDIDFKNKVINFRVVKRERQCVGAKIDENGEPEFKMAATVYEEGLKNGDDVKVQKLENMPQVLEILYRRRGQEDCGPFVSERVFPNAVKRSWQTLIKSTGIENFRWHDFRHCCGSYLRQDGKDLGIIGSHLGHKSSASTARYSHLSGEETLETGAAISKKLYG